MYAKMQIFIIGCGKIGSAFAKVLAPHFNVLLYNRSFEKAQALAKETQSEAVSLQTGLSEANFAILAFKPKDLKEFSSNLPSLEDPSTIFLSTLAGTSLSTLETLLPSYTHIRVMPNLPLSVGAGALGLTTTMELTTQQRENIEKLFAPCGKSFWLSEAKLEAFTPLAGSGPAFIATIIESMAEAGIAMGLSAEESLEITLQTMKGVVNVVQEVGKHPAELRWDTCSPGGVSIAGVRRMEAKGLRSAVIESFLATYEALLKDK
ncbi:MAG: pyrroline-5-carboxylate reductase [Waddliaceae bacterium]|nr:pyrroline-5-carboxylate reductase [Waddliaceae bacterium]